MPLQIVYNGSFEQNASLQVGDIAYSAGISYENNNNTQFGYPTEPLALAAELEGGSKIVNPIEKIGKITAIGPSYVYVESPTNIFDHYTGVGDDVNDGTQSLGNDLGNVLMFQKDRVWNTSGLTGYYAEIKIANNNRGHAELFSIGSEIAPSSK